MERLPVKASARILMLWSSTRSVRPLSTSYGLILQAIRRSMPPSMRAK
ncbi:MAG: hypothetical protein ACD_75C02205G0001 [uncultured bacterium]|nr:MAG: hypothetical protein ACD_75C02205G0001 [uncultured bacterium]